MIRLKSVTYAEFEGKPEEWKLDTFSLGHSNLIVGKNASGKSRTLNLIGALSANLSGIRPPGLAGDYDVEFIDDGKLLKYHLKYEQNQVLEESFEIDGKLFLDRDLGGVGNIYASEVNKGEMIRFQTPTTEFAAVARRDSIQHAFLEPLHIWASSVRHYQFGTPLGKDHLAVVVERGGIEPDDRNPDNIVGLFLQATKNFGEKFSQSIAADMRQLNYDVKGIGTIRPTSIQLSPNAPQIVSLFAQENDLKGITDQHTMSQGMFRALSILILVNYSQFSGKSSCLLIDDIGEGLDFDRSCRLINLLRAKAKEPNVQLIMSTNDRFIMNQVPLEEWAVIQRNGGLVRILNYENSKSLFEDFKFTGLSNFSFLEMDFANQTPEEA